MRIPPAVAGAAIAGLGLVACSGPQGVSVPPGADRLTACEVTVLSVEDLAARGEPGCDLTGSTLTFPDGFPSLTIDAVGATYGYESPEGQILINNWGAPGVGAATFTADDRLIGVWASTPEALDLQRQQLRIEGVSG